MNIPTAPPALTCLERKEPTADATELEKLQYCRDAVECSISLTNYNSAIAKYNDTINLLNKAAEETWENKKEADINAKKKELESERKDTRCVLWTDFSWFGKQNTYCRNDFGLGFEADYDIVNAGVRGAKNGGCIVGQGVAQCRRTGDNIKTLLDNYTSTYTSKPIPEPLLEQNNSNVNINCCLNFMNIVGTAKDNEQTCLSTIDQLTNQKIEQKTDIVTAEIMQITPPIVTDSEADTETKESEEKGDTDTENTEKKQSEEKSDTESKEKDTSLWLTYAFIGFVIFIIFFLFIIGIVIIV